MTWDQVTALPCVDFLAWVDQHFRCRVVSALLRRVKSCSMVDAEDSWQALMLSIWHGNRTAAEWSDAEHLQRFLHAGMFRQLRWAWGRAATTRRYKSTAKLMSELESEQVQQTLELIAREPTPPPSMSSSVNWFSAALADLTPKQRRAVELCIVGDMPNRDADTLDACTPGTMKDRIRSVRQRIAKHIFTDAMGQRFYVGSDGHLYTMEAA